MQFSFLVSAALLAVSAHAQYAFHFEFDQAGVLPDATPGVAAGNNSGTPTATLFGAACGRLQQRTSINPTLGAFFYSGSFLSYPPIGTGLNPTLPAFIEARFRQVGGTGGPGTVMDSTAVMGIYPGVATNMAANVVTGDVGMWTAGGFLWTTPAGGTAVAHTYRLETIPAGGQTYCLLSIDGVVVLGPALAAPPGNINGWFFGDAAGSNYISQDLDWEYVSIGQVNGSIGQANSPAASLFVNRDSATAVGMVGLAGPFSSVIPSGSTMTLEWNGPPGAIFALFLGGSLQAGTASFGCGGSADLSLPWTVAFDPFSPIYGQLFQLDACGYSRLSFLVPAAPPGVLLLSIQGVVLQSGGCPYVLTAAHQVTT